MVFWFVIVPFGFLIFLGVYFYFQAINGRGRPCPQCGTRVKPRVMVCEHCQYDFRAAEKGNTAAKVPANVLKALRPPSTPEKGWRADPLDEERLRWWDGEQWTDNTGIRASTPPDTAAAPQAAN